MISNREELSLQFSTWFRSGATETLEQFVSNCLEKITLNPYPLLEKSNADETLRLMIDAALDSIQHGKNISEEIDEYLSDVIFQIYVGQSTRSSLETTFQQLKRIDLSERWTLKICGLFDGDFAEEISRVERKSLSPIDLQNGPDRLQMHLAMKLNLFKLSSSSSSSSSLIGEMLQCLNIVLLLADPLRSFVELFDTTDEHLQSLPDESFRVKVLCQLIEGLTRHSPKNDATLKSSKILLQCLEAQPTNEALIHCGANYLSVEHREEFIYLICENPSIDLSILFCEIRSNPKIVEEKFLAVILDHLNECSAKDTIECLWILIEGMEKKQWKNTFRLKQKSIWKFIKRNAVEPSLFERTIEPRRLND